MLNCKLVKIIKLSGAACSVYSIIENDAEETLLEKFIKENIDSFKSETKEIIQRLRTMGRFTGARPEFFKEHEGKPSDGVCALFDDKKSHLRLYCIRFGTQLVVMGGGGYKPKSIRKLQQDEKLKRENYFLRELSEKITSRIKEKEIWFSHDNMEFKGNLEFNDEEY